MIKKKPFTEQIFCEIKKKDIIIQWKFPSLEFFNVFSVVSFQL